MSRARRTDLHLPQRVYFKAGRYRYFSPDRKWHTLGREWDRTAKGRFEDLSRGLDTPNTVAALLTAFLKHREQQVRDGTASARTLVDNEQEARELKAVFGTMQVNSIKRQHVARFLRERADKNKKPAPVRANREAALLSSAYSWAMGLREWDINENPCYGVRRNTERPRRRYIETRELAHWRHQNPPKWLRAYVLLKRLTGARQGEMLRLTRASLTDQGIRFGITKTGRVKIVRWSWALKVAVNSLLAMDKGAMGRTAFPLQDVELGARPVFLNTKGAGMTTFGFKSAWARSMAAHLAAGGVRFQEHDIRAKTASDMSTARAQEVLDHASPAMTRKVYQRAPTKVRPLR